MSSGNGKSGVFTHVRYPLNSLNFLFASAPNSPFSYQPQSRASCESIIAANGTYSIALFTAITNSPLNCEKSNPFKDVPPPTMKQRLPFQIPVGIIVCKDLETILLPVLSLMKGLKKFSCLCPASGMSDILNTPPISNSLRVRGASRRRVTHPPPSLIHLKLL